MNAPAPTPVPTYDYLIIGGGAAGLSLAYHLAQEPSLADKRVLLIEPDEVKADDRTWRYWAVSPTPFEAIEARRWAQLVIRAPKYEQVFELGSYRYRMVRAGDFYQYVQGILDARLGQFTRLVGRVDQIVEAPDNQGALATLVDGQQMQARYAFDSRLPQLVRQPSRYRYLEQHFLGWEVETDEDCFDPSAVQLMDFNVPQSGQARFVYILPFTKRRALVEFTVFSAQRLLLAEYQAELQDYLAKYLGKQPYRILAEEGGSIPMTDHPLPAQVSPHIVNIGTRAGRSKPSTGYTFARIQQHSVHLVTSLVATGKPPVEPTDDQWQFYLFDKLLLDIMQRQGETTRDIFAQLFKNNPIERIFQFLDEKTNWIDNLRIMNSVSAGPFLYSIVQVLRGRTSNGKKS